MSRKGKGGGGDPKEQFWSAVISQKMDTLRWCLSNCNGLEASTQNDEGLTSFMVAAKGDKWKSMQMLIDFYSRNPVLREHGWVECREPEHGKTALMIACEVGSIKCVDFLLDAQPQGRGERRGVNDPTLGEELLKQKDSSGKTALHYAKTRKKDDLARLIEDYLAPPEDDTTGTTEGGPGGDGVSSTQRSKQKKRALLAQSGSDALQKHQEEEEKYQQRLEEERAANKAAAAIQNRKPVWPEVAKVDSTAEKSSKICEVSVVRAQEGDDCPAHGDAKNPIDPALWDLVMLNRLLIRLPPGVLTSVPEDLSRLTHLQTLILSKNSLESLPDSIGELGDLKVLEVEDCGLRELPKSLGKCAKLEVFKAGRNNLTTLEPLEPVTSLAIVHADNNVLTSFEGLSLKKLARLSELCLQANRIDEIPDDIGSCTVLAKLALTNNQITEIPQSIIQLKKVKELVLDGNPLGDNKIKKYLEAGGKGLKDLWKYLEKNAKKGGGKKKQKKKKSGSDEEEED